jgi:hypothetical protein
LLDWQAVTTEIFIETITITTIMDISNKS